MSSLAPLHLPFPSACLARGPDLSSIHELICPTPLTLVSPNRSRTKPKLLVHLSTRLELATPASAELSDLRASFVTRVEQAISNVLPSHDHKDTDTGELPPSASILKKEQPIDDVGLLAFNDKIGRAHV